MKAHKVLRLDFEKLLKDQKEFGLLEDGLCKDERSSNYKKLLYTRLLYLQNAHKKLKTNKVVNSNKFVIKSGHFNRSSAERMIKVQKIQEDAQNKINKLKNVQRPESGAYEVLQDKMVTDSELILQQ